MSKKHTLLWFGMIILGCFLIVALSLWIARVRLASTQVDSRSQKTSLVVKAPPQNNTPTSVLSFSPATLVVATASARQVETVFVNIDSGMNDLQKINLDLNYDPNVLTNLEVSPGGAVLYSSPDVKSSAENGHINLSATLNTSGSTASSIKGPVLKISFTPKSGIFTTNIKFLPTTTLFGSDNKPTLKSIAEEVIRTN